MRDILNRIALVAITVLFAAILLNIWLSFSPLLLAPQKAIEAHLNNALLHLITDKIIQTDLLLLIALLAIDSSYNSAFKKQ